MLEFAGSVALGMDVGDLLELQGALHGNGEVEAAADKKEVLAIIILLGQPLDFILQPGNLPLKQVRQVDETRHQPFPVPGADGVADFAQQEHQQKQGGKLAGKGLGGGHPDFRPGMGIDGAV